MDGLGTPMSRCTFCQTEGTVCLYYVCICISFQYTMELFKPAAPHRPYSEPVPVVLSVWLHRFSSDKSKRRTKTVKKSAEPKWNQTFIYSHVHRRDFRERMLEITVWDQPRVQEEESEFLGEVRDRSFLYKYIKVNNNTYHHCHLQLLSVPGYVSAGFHYIMYIIKCNI